MAIYPVMFTAYLAFLYPLGTASQLAVGIALVWIAGLLNFLGVRPTGNASVVLAVLLSLPFAALVIVGFGRLVHWQPPAGRIFGHDFAGALGAGLTVVIWNFSGWENASVVAGEIRDARHTYLRALIIALPLVVLGYLLPLSVTLSGARGPHWANWQTGWFTTEGYRMGGMALGAALALGGTLSSFAIFEAAMLWVSRMPYVLACEGYLPPTLAKVWPTTEIPGRSIFACCVLFTLLVPLGFTALVILDVFFYMGALALEMAALIRMRRMRPARDGLYVIGGGKLGLWTVALAPVLTWCATFGLAIAHGGAHVDFVVALVLAATAYPAYALCRGVWGGPAMAEDAAAALSPKPASLP
jgi:amino acid transporter